jgi:nucleoid-associated protein YgaU
VVQQASSGSQAVTNGSSDSDRSGDGAETDSSSSYTVQDGDRLWNIVKEQYGSATYERVQSVAEHNDINPRDLRPGMELELPADLASTDSTGSSSTTQTSSSGDASSTAGNPPFEPDPGQKWYRVQDGENLWRISEKEYGSGKYFSRIWELNKDRLEDYNSLSSGTWVLLPESP